MKFGEDFSVAVVFFVVCVLCFGAIVCLVIFCPKILILPEPIRFSKSLAFKSSIPKSL